MILTTYPSRLSGTVCIPGSKSHTVRAVLIAAMARGESTIRRPLIAADTRSALAAAQGLGAEIKEEDNLWRIRGTGGAPRAAGQLIDVGNSGTTLFIALGMASLIRQGEICFDGDQQTRRRSAANLIRSLNDLGSAVTSEGDKPGCCPIRVRPRLRGGRTSIECPTSQYLTSLLLCTPLAEQDTEITVPLLYEHPYAGMTLDWLKRLGIKIEALDDLSHFYVPGGQSYCGFDRDIPADFSSATFFLCAAAITGSELVLPGLDMADSQGDRAVVEYLRAMGARIETDANTIHVRSGAELRGVDLDLNATPDALPAMAVSACFARGRTVLGNVPQARIKETDRIAVMARELSRLGGRVQERADGLVIDGAGLKSGRAHGHRDHRVVMAFAIAGLAADGPISVDTAETAAITFPNFVALLRAAGAKVEEREEK